MKFSLYLSNQYTTIFPYGKVRDNKFENIFSMICIMLAIVILYLEKFKSKFIVKMLFSEFVYCSEICK